MVLDTKGVNVWCSAGKGTFSTDEIVGKIKSVDLPRIVNHGILLLPQLSALGVAAHEVRKRSGFKVVYGPIKARDIAPFLDSDMKAAPEMRRVSASLVERLVLAPMELVGALKIMLIIYAVLFIMNGFRIVSLEPSWWGVCSSLLCFPGFPGDPLLSRGWLLGIVWAFAVNANRGLLFSSSPSWEQSLVNFLTLPALASFPSEFHRFVHIHLTIRSGERDEICSASDLNISGCGMGVEVCPRGVFARQDGEAYLTDRDLCMEWGLALKIVRFLPFQSVPELDVPSLS